MSAENGKAPTGWTVSKVLWGITSALVVLLYNDARGDTQRLAEKVEALTTVISRLSRLEGRVEDIDNRTTRIENKLDDVLDRNPYANRPGPR
jgi:hypothetical protein